MSAHAIGDARTDQRVPGAADVRLQQIVDYPELFIDVDRTRAGEVGIKERDVTNTLLVTPIRHFQVGPAFLAQSRRTESPIRSWRSPRNIGWTPGGMEKRPVTGSAIPAKQEVLGGLGK